MDSTTLITSFILIVSGLVGVLLALGLAYHRLLDQVHHLSKNQQVAHDKTYHQAEEIIDQARAEALEIVRHADHKAGSIVTQAEKFAEEQKTELAHRLQSTSQDELSAYSETLKESQEKILTSLGNVSDELGRTAEKELSAFKEELIKSTSETQSLLSKQLHEDFAQTQSSVQKYQQLLMNQADQHMFEVIKNIFEEVLHKSLTRSEHEDLVMKALEEAKKQHVL